MSKFCPVLVFVFVSFKVTGQNKFFEAFSFETKVTGDFVYNFNGGIKKGYTSLGMEEFTMFFDTEKAGLWRNGIFLIHGLNTHGTGPSEKLTGDLQAMSNIEAGDYTGLYEIWFSQTFGNLTFILGQHDLNSEFIGSEYGGTFINSSFGIAPSIALNVPVSIYPVTAPCLMAKYQNENKFDVKYAIYDGDPGNFENNRFNLEWDINSYEGFLNISEFVFYLNSRDLPIGTFKLGGYYHTGKFLDYSDTLSNKKGNFGLYIVTDLNIFPRSLSNWRGLCFFFQGGIAPPEINWIHYYIGTGFRYHGLLPNRFNDELGIALAHVQLSSLFRRNSTIYLPFETALECTYVFHFGMHYALQPSVQYIINPGATTNYRNSFTSLLRFTLTY